MPVSKPRPGLPANSPAPADASCAEAPAWGAIGAGCRPLFGDVQAQGFSFEWHDFTAAEELDWGRSFHPGSVELCLNLAGRATVADGQRSMALKSGTRAFYFHGDPPLQARRCAEERHRFVTVVYTVEFLKRHLQAEARNLHPLVRAVVERPARRSVVADPEPIHSGVLQLVEGLRRCPVFKAAQETWFRCKALELATQTFFCPPEGELLCTRQQRAACERAARTRQILCGRLADPPSLEELGRLVGCSPFYLSRQFSDATGLTIQQFLRQARLERAAELLRAGKHNVTEAALEVGYNSLSHFTGAFREVFGCCPGLYPIKTMPASIAQPGGGRKQSSAP